MKTIIIGGVAAGMSAAAKLRRLDKDHIIHVYEKGNDLSYGACGMPYYLGGIIKDAEDLVVKTKDDFEKLNIKVFLNHEVITVIPEEKTITIINSYTNEIIYDTYDKLLIATGSSAKRSFVSGSNNPNIHVLRTLEDARRLHNIIQGKRSVAIIGAGYIGCEVAENLAQLGMKVHLIEASNQILNFYDYDVAKLAEIELENNNISVHTRETLTSYNILNDSIKVTTDTNTYEVDIVLETIGVKPNTIFLRETNMDMLENGAIIVNDKLETSIKDIYAAGDCAAYYHNIKNDYAFVPLGTHANKTGRIVAENILGNNISFHGIVGSSILKVNTLAVAKTGLGYDEARDLHLDVDYIDVNTKNHAHYYPNTENLFIRIVYEQQTGILKGAQIVGKVGVSDRINIMALAITKQLTAKEFSQLDFAYTPPYNSVWDPLQIATNLIKL